MDYIAINKDSWNRRVNYHLKSDFYDMPSFMAGKCSLNDIEKPLLGDLRGKRLLHLQCHFGQDTLSLARLGAEVTGLDFSDAAISRAEAIAAELGIEARFVCCDVYEAVQQLAGEQFDVIFTSYGTIGWLPDLDKWAAVINTLLADGGKFVFADFHPVVWMFDNNFTQFAYNYFKEEVIYEVESGTYADSAAPELLESATWNHSISEMLGSLLRQGLRIEHFDEYDYSPYNCFASMTEDAPRQFRVAHLGRKIPMVYSVVARK